MWVIYIVTTEVKGIMVEHSIIKFSLPGDLVSKESTCHAGQLGLIPGSGRCPGEGNGNPLQYSCLRNAMDRGTWRGTVHRIARVGHDVAAKPSPSHISCLYFYFHANFSRTILTQKGMSLRQMIVTNNSNIYWMFSICLLCPKHFILFYLILIKPLWIPLIAVLITSPYWWGNRTQRYIQYYFITIINNIYVLFLTVGLLNL